MVLNALHGDALPVYGDGMQVRNWIHASDFARALDVPGRQRDGRDARMPAAANPKLGGATTYRVLKQFVVDRPGHGSSWEG